MNTCKKKGHRTSYNIQHDAYFCKQCDRWLESKCPKIKALPCELCDNRPRRPSLVPTNQKHKTIGG